MSAGLSAFRKNQSVGGELYSTQSEKMYFATTAQRHASMAPTSFGAFAKQNKFAASFDFKAWFFQFRALGTVLTPFATRAVNGTRPVRAPMGHKFHVFCAHTVTKALLSMALVESKVARAAYDVIIDNILVAHNDPTQLEALCDTFHSVCRRY